MNHLTARALFDQAKSALTITDCPSWTAVEEPGFIDTLCFLEHDPDTNEPAWVLVRHRDGTTPPSFEEAADDDDSLPIDASLAIDLLRSHFVRWLGERGWQVQFSLHKQRYTWRLADCLSFAQGGGDRLNADYPFGDDEFVILCESVQTLTGPM